MLRRGPGSCPQVGWCSGASGGIRRVAGIHRREYLAAIALLKIRAKDTEKAFREAEAKRKETTTPSRSKT